MDLVMRRTFGTWPENVINSTPSAALIAGGKKTVMA
jgi:hypothetical protein